ncbi:MAG TPA: hypothetical protein VMU77_00910, partial [Acidimicrobiales bacterium]|nr:hypothetical protein [Acidimicrobiales bacterium]
EIRAFPPQPDPATGIISGIFNDFRKAAQAATAITHKYPHLNIYYTINPINPESRYLADIERNRPFLHSRLTARDSDIVDRNIYLIDIDPNRPSGTSATDAERGEARSLAMTIQDYLASQGWSLPTAICSGNGYQLIYRAEGCNPEGTNIKHALKYLATTFDTDAAHIDLAVYNSSRIARLPFTWNRKGPDTPERPHRQAYVEHWPVDGQKQIANFQVYNIAQLGGYSVERAERQRKMYQGGDLIIDEDGVLKLIKEFPDFLDLHKITHDGDITMFGLTSCPFNGGPHRHQFVGAGKSAIILSPDKLGFKCFSDDCAEHGIGDLLRLLGSETQRRPSMTIWADPPLDPKLDAIWDLEDEGCELDPTESAADDLLVYPIGATTSERLSIREVRQTWNEMVEQDAIDPSWKVPTPESILQSIRRSRNLA